MSISTSEPSPPLPSTDFESGTSILSPEDSSTTQDSRDSGITQIEKCVTTGNNNNNANDDNTNNNNNEKDNRDKLTEAECYDKLGFSFSPLKKWSILAVIFWIQTSMNFNASLYANGISGLSEHFDISHQTARVGQMIFLVAYAFGCELWAPWSEESGRWIVLQLSLLFVNIWQIPCALAPNFATIVVGRFLGGISSAGGSVTLGIVADMWEPENQQYAVAFVVFSSVGGSVFGPIVGGFIETYCSWHWIFWAQLIFGVAVQIVHFWVPETRASVLMSRIAQRRRKNGEPNLYTEYEMENERLTWGHIVEVWIRPFKMFVTEPIVLCLSLLSGFSDSLIFSFLASYGLVFAQWGFTSIEVGLTFIGLLVGYIIAYLSFIPPIRRQTGIMRARGIDALQPEKRLWWLLYTVPLEAIGLFGFAWTSLGPPIPWIAPLIFATLIAIANYSIYMATIDYMVAAYGEYSASATGGNGFARDFLAGIAAMYSVPFYENVGGKYHLEWPSTILGFLAIIVAIPVYVFYVHGEWFRERSKFAISLAEKRHKIHDLIDQTVVPETCQQGTLGGNPGTEGAGNAV